MRLAAVCLAAFALCGRAQQGKPLTFDAASIKPHREDAGPNPKVTKRGASTPPRAGFLYFRPGMVVSGRTGLTARGIILEAYRLSSPQLSGGPDWLASDTFDVQAKAGNATQSQLRTMLQTLLAERFHLVVHRQKENLAVYTIVLPKNGTKLHEWKEGERMPMPAENHAMNYRAAGTMEDLAAFPSSDPHG